MRKNYLAYAFSMILLHFGVLILTPVVFSIYYREYSSILPFVVASSISILLGLICKLIAKLSNVDNLNDIKKSEGLFIVTTSWILGGLIASLPFLFYGMNIIDALFESASGITTTGASICMSVAYPKSIMFWRALIQWIGGMGIIILFIAVLPQFAVAGRQMFFAESPGPTEEKFTPRIRNTASALWKVYITLTLIETIVLKFAGMPLFDSLCNSLSTLSAGGFSPNASSTMGYNSNLITWIILIFIFLSGTSFSLQYKAYSKLDIFLLFKNEEFRAYLLTFLGISALVIVSLMVNDHFNLFYSITNGMYQVISLMTSTGSTSADYASWDLTTKILLFIAMFTGGCASSASGGIKIARWVLIGKIMKMEVKKILHPNAVMNIKMDNSIIPRDILSQTVMFICFYMGFIAFSVVVVSILEQNIVVGISGSIASIGNIGPAFGHIIGPMNSYETLHPISKLILIFDMYVGRLELIPFLVMLEPEFWSFR
jgi:trk system potassium uptake protein TrkH